MPRKNYRASDVTVSFDPERCIHSEECVSHLPEVFDVEKRPWIQPDNATPQAISTTVTRCPTGALKFSRSDGTEEATPQRNRAIVSGDGPLYLRGDVRLTDEDGGSPERETRVALCRCGASSSKPFCDNSHVDSGFRHDGSLGEDWLDGESSPTDEPDGELRVSPSENGPLNVKGEIEVCDASGETSYYGSKTSLCRCGGSSNKPFCDGTHAKSGWTSD